MKKLFITIFSGFCLIFAYIYIAGTPLQKLTLEGLISLSSANQTVENKLEPINNPTAQAENNATSTLTEQLTAINPEKATQISATDARIVAMRKFLIDKNSPMYPYADVFVTEADKQGLDWRLVAAISGIESNFGKVTPRDSNNAWGWKGGPGGTWSKFPTFREGIRTITNGLANGYGRNLTPYQIEPTYCPPCAQNPAHIWARTVTKFMNDLEIYRKNVEKDIK